MPVPVTPGCHTPWRCITWVMGSDPTDESKARRVVRPAPGIELPAPRAWAVVHDRRPRRDREAGFVTHLAASTVDAQAITAPPISDSDEARSALDEGPPHFPTAYLAGGIEYRATEVQKAAQIERISDSTLARRPPQGRRPIPPSRVR